MAAGAHFRSLWLARSPRTPRPPDVLKRLVPRRAVSTFQGDRRRRMRSRSRLGAFLQRTDILVCLLPLTPDTRTSSIAICRPTEPTGHRGTGPDHAGRGGLQNKRTSGVPRRRTLRRAFHLMSMPERSRRRRFWTPQGRPTPHKRRRHRSRRIRDTSLSDRDLLSRRRAVDCHFCRIPRAAIDCMCRRTPGDAEFFAHQNGLSAQSRNIRRPAGRARAIESGGLLRNAISLMLCSLRRGASALVVELPRLIAV